MSSLRRRSRTPSASQEVLDKYLRAGAIARKAREFGASHVRAGGSSLELANAIESLIREQGGGCAFPVNIGVNAVAAHYTPSKDNDLRFRTGDVVKIDVGAHVDGYPADTSATVEVGTRNHTALIESANDALRVCVEMVAPGTPISAMGAAVARTIKAAGFKPIQNLTGHSMERYNLHAGLSIPNIETKDRAVLKEGMVIAVEPFSTTGAGKVDGRGRGSIYRIVRERRAPADVAPLLAKVKAEFGSFPFAKRWCERLDPNYEALVQKMFRLGIIMSYPVLTEIADGIVAQAEHSVIVTSNG
ncbi:MAG: type II methionyl aminopeptidase, partial [Thermoplasmata archaeon]